MWDRFGPLHLVVQVEQRRRQERHEQAADNRVDDDDLDRPAGERKRDWHQRDVGQGQAIRRAGHFHDCQPLGRRQLLEDAVEVGIQVRHALPHAEQRREHRRPEAGREGEPAEVAQQRAQGRGHLRHRLGILQRHAGDEERITGDQHDRDAEQCREDVGDSDVTADVAQEAGAAHLLFAHPVVVGQHRDRAADAADERQHVGAAAGRNDRDQQALDRGCRVVQRQRRADQDAEAHDANQQLHQLLEAGVSAQPDEGEADQAVHDSAPRLGNRSAREVGNAQARGVGQRRADGDRPDQQVGAEVPLDPARQVISPAFKRGLAGGQLPAGNPLAEDELEEGAGDNRPQQHDAVARATDCRRDNIAGADAGGGHDQARAGQFEKAERVRF